MRSYWASVMEPCVMCVKRFWFSEHSIYFFCFPSRLFSKVEGKWTAVTGKYAKSGEFLGCLQGVVNCLSRKILYICMSGSARRLYVVSEIRSYQSANCAF